MRRSMSFTALACAAALTVASLAGAPTASARHADQAVASKLAPAGVTAQKSRDATFAVVLSPDPPAAVGSVSVA